MKRVVKLTGMLLILTIVLSSGAEAQRGMRGMAGQKPDSAMMKNFRGFQHGPLVPGGRMGQDIPFRGGMQGMHQYGMPFAGRGDRPGNRGMRILEIPGLSENQKKEIAYLNVKHAENLKKIREDMAAQLQKTRDDHRKAVENLLTDEQKKLIAPAVPAAK